MLMLKRKTTILIYRFFSRLSTRKQSMALILFRTPNNKVFIVGHLAYWSLWLYNMGTSNRVLHFVFVPSSVRDPRMVCLPLM